MQIDMFDDPNKLSNEKIREELTKAGISQELIDSIVEQFWFHDWGNSFIAFPSNFLLLQKFLAETKPDKFSRFDYYTYFYHNIISDFEKFREPLQKIALVFELMQTDQLPLSEFTDLLKEINAPALLSIKNLQDRQLVSIIESEGNQIAKWSHHTLTEYLAADYILSQKEVLKTAVKLMIYSSSGLTRFIPSWIGTLRFLLEQNPEPLLNWIIKFIEKNPDFMDDQLAETLVFSTHDSISAGYKTQLFHIVYDSFQGKKWWIPVWAYNHLFKFIDEKIYQKLKSQTDEKDYIYRGNIAAIIDGMLQHNHPLIQKEKEFWKAKLIEYANDKNGNGVLQRHAMAALENFQGENDIIQKVQERTTSPDSLVREAFINMCKVVDPNFPESIEFFIKAIADDSAHIYARNALYSINSEQGIKTFLESIINNPRFIHEFLDKESIFNKKEKQADEELIDNIQKNLNTEIITLIKKIIIVAFTGDHNYNAGKSYFLQQLTRIVQSERPDYLRELIKTIEGLTNEQKKNLFINDIEGIIAVLLKPEDLEELQKIFTDQLHDYAPHVFTQAIRMAPYVDNPQGEAVLKRGIELNITVDPKTLPKYDDYQKQQEAKIYKQFLDYLNPPTEGQYFPQVFSCFIESQKIIEDQWKEPEKERLLNLAIDSNLDKIEPEKIKVHYKDQETKSGEYTVSSIAAYFGSILQVIHKLKPSVLELPKNRQKVINFIPFAYNNDLKVIQEILGNVTDKELETVNGLMKDQTKDIRYLIPQTYIYFSSTIPNLKSPKGVLMSFVKDQFIGESDRECALRNLERYLSSSDPSDETFLKSLWNPDIRNSLSDRANSLLISVFHDNKSIVWRFEILKSLAKPFQKQEGVHSVGELEHELDSMVFAKPLIELNDEKYLDKFISLLDFSLTIIDKAEYWESINYLWRIAIAFVIRDDFLLSQSALQKLKAWARQNKNVSNINWFNKRLEDTIAKSMNALMKVNKISEALNLMKA